MLKRAEQNCAELVKKISIFLPKAEIKNFRHFFRDDV